VGYRRLLNLLLGN